MLKIIHADLFDYAAPGSIIAHGCNMQGVMGAGFAREIRYRFPKAFLEYRRVYSEGQLELGSFILVHTKGYNIYNCITQERYGRDPRIVYVDYKALRQSLKHVANYSAANDLPIHIPFIGAGHAHGDPDILMNIFEEIFVRTNAVLYLQQDNHGHSNHPKHSR